MITMDDIEKQIVRRSFHRFPDTPIVGCALTLKSGYVATGFSPYVMPAQFNQKLAMETATNEALSEVSEVLTAIQRQRYYESIQEAG